MRAKHPGAEYRRVVPDICNYRVSTGPPQSAFRIRVDRDRYMGTQNRDEIFTADPAQAVLALELCRTHSSPIFLIMRMQVLIFLHLPGQDIVKMEVVRRTAATSTGFCVDSSAASSRLVDNFRT